jgi:RNase P subunit RPR2
MANVRQQKPGDPIPTNRLPLRCPACARKEPTNALTSGEVIRLTCLGCGWTERYQIRSEVIR